MKPIDIDEWPNLVAMLLSQAQARGDRAFLWEKRGERYEALSWRTAADRVASVAAALQANGLKPGDRVILLAHNSPNWAIADFAIMAAGGVTVPVYTTNTTGNHDHIAGDSGATMAIVSTAALARPFFAAKKTRSLRHAIVMEDLGDIDVGRVAVSSWSEAVATPADIEALTATANAIEATSLACLIYTSGTGGDPKGVMLSHRAILTNCVGAAEVLDELGLGDEVFLSFLPLSHAYEHTAGLMFPVSIGAEIYFAERVDTLSTNLLEARPTIMTAVPRLYEIMHERIVRDIGRQSRLRARLFWAAVELGRKRYERPDLMTARDRFVDRIVDKLVRDKVRARFGGRLKALVSGGAPLNYEIGVFFTALGLLLLQGYGQTEAAPVITVNRCNRVKLRTVGPPLKHVELRIADDGEILVRGPLLMDGYWKLPKLTAETLRDGWLRTGDIGVIDKDGYLQITDRKKDIIVNSGGDTLSPLRIESMLALEPEIELAVAIGDNRPHIVAVIVPSANFCDDWAKANGGGKDLSQLAGNPAFRAAIGKAVERANTKLTVAERVKRFVVADRNLTTENGMMTPTMKPRRHEVVRHWAGEIAQLY